MKTHIQLPSKQRGFSLLTAFIVVVIIFASLAYFLAGQGINSSISSSFTNKSKVSGLLSSAGYISTGFDAVQLNGTAVTDINFSSTTAAPAVGLFNSSTGAVVPQGVDPSLIAPGITIDFTTSYHGAWLYRPNAVQMRGVGVGANKDYVLMVTGLAGGICSQINSILHGTLPSATPPTSGATLSAMTGVYTAPYDGMLFTSSTVVDLTTTTAASTDGWLSGCYKTTDASAYYVYIHTLLAQ